MLRQISRETTNEPVVLFHPSDATRSISRGVAIDYYLKQAADKVTIEFLDAQGKTITHVHRNAAGRAAGERARRQRRPRPTSRTKRAAAAAVHRRGSRSSRA